ncbi:hypothetical protein [Aureimonas sp. AU40]|uniref:hypothetical protein n=1 Tax=Aureimonas sp. AU40 TaxID=1637747 RepID=UPI000782A59F|nr:hypothetical protein [Aureimonas sp. AU40]
MLNHTPPRYASPELSPSLGGLWRGRIDRFDPINGIEGWAVAIEEPGRRVELELSVGGYVMALGTTGLARPDIDIHVSPRCRAGFRFDPSVFGRLARLAAHRHDKPVSLRVAGTDVTLLPPAGRAPSVGELVAQWREAILSELGRREAPRSKGDRLLGQLRALRLEAERLRERPLLPHSDGEIGQIDLVHLSSDGQVWFIGWAKRGIDTEFPAVVADRVKHPAGIAVAPYERSDLSANCVGVVGLIETGWTPPAHFKDGFVFAGDKGQFHLRLTPQTRLVRADAFTAAYQQLQPALVGGQGEAMGAVLASLANWLPGASAAGGVFVEGGVDRLLLIPGFGCIAEGWAVSPAKRTETFHLKIGDTVLTADETCTYFRPRTDLQGAFGSAPSVTARAGFTTIFRGALPVGASAAPLLRVVLEDGTSAVLRVDPKVPRRLDLVTDGDEVLALYPSLRFEPVYPALVSAVQDTLRAEWRAPAVLALAPAERAVVQRLPADEGNLRLVFDRAARYLPDLEPGTGLAFVADTGRNRSEALLRFEELRARTEAPLSLFVVAHPDEVVAELPWMLARMEAKRFVHVGRGVALTAAGWAGARASLARRGHSVDRFEIVDDEGRPDRIDGALSAAAFGWSTPALIDWSRTAPRFLRGTHAGGALPEQPGLDRLVAGGAVRLERPRLSRLADLIEADILKGAAR